MEVSEGAQSVGRAAQSLRSLFPDLEMNHISLLGKGWDSVAYLVNDNIVVRVPRRPAVGRQMEKEVRVLEAIRPYVSVRLPFIEWVGQPQGEFTVSAIGYRKLSGTPLSAIEPGSARDNALRQVGQFLRDLHAIPTSVLNKANVPWFRWTGDNNVDGPDGWERGLRSFTDRIIQQAVPLLDTESATRVTREVAAFLAEPQHFDFQPVPIHGDLAPEHILVDTGGGKIGVIDFGDCGMGDPAYDVGDEFLPLVWRPNWPVPGEAAILSPSGTVSRCAARPGDGGCGTDCGWGARGESGVGEPNLKAEKRCGNLLREGTVYSFAICHAY